MSSLRVKILSSFGLPMLALLVFAAVLVADLLYLNTRILEGVKVNAFYVASQDMRREEKNLLLYHQNADYTHALQQLDRVDQAYQDSRTIFSELASRSELAEVAELLKLYRTQLQRFAAANAADDPAAQASLRDFGHHLLTWARELGQRERASLADAAQFAVTTLLAALVTVILIALVSAMMIIRQVLRPLRDLSDQLDAVADGHIRELTMRSKDREIESVVLHFNDMLGRLRSQQSRLRKHEKAAALGVLVSGVAHELNNPLSNISTSVQLLLESDDATSRELRDQWMSHIDEESERARRIVRRLLDSVRQPRLHLSVCELPDLVETSVNLVTGQVAETTEVHILEIPAVRLYLDRERLQQVFINLVKNAADAGAQNVWIDANETTWRESRPASMELVCGDNTQVDEANTVMRIEISDDGPGIPADSLPHIFNPFFTTQSGHDGTGLGLYLVEEIISEHDACIGVENRREGGTRFTIWLPLPDKQEAA
jgi:signal transduction histidine kinase